MVGEADRFRRVQKHGLNCRRQSYSFQAVCHRGVHRLATANRMLGLLSMIVHKPRGGASKRTSTTRSATPKINTFLTQMQDRCVHRPSRSDPSDKNKVLETLITSGRNTLSLQVVETFIPEGTGLATHYWSRSTAHHILCG